MHKKIEEMKKSMKEKENKKTAPNKRPRDEIAIATPATKKAMLQSQVS